MARPSLHRGAMLKPHSSTAAACVLLTIAAACAPPAKLETRETRSATLASPREEAPEIPAAIDIQPANGTTFGGRTAERAVTFSGFATGAGVTIEVQVLRSPTVAIADTSWVTLATTVTEATPTTFNDPTPIFRWRVTATPGSTRWPLGGLMRFRTIATDAAGRKTALPFFDESAGLCVERLRARSWREVLAQCKSPFSPDLGGPITNQTRAAAIVSTGREPGNAGFTPPYLNRKGEITVEDTKAYYAAIDAPATLDEYKERFGFGESRGEVETTFFNAGDLGIGREMHCLESKDDVLACYVTNYGVDADGAPLFNGDPDAALDDAIARRNGFATVAMAKFGTKYNDPRGNDVQFFVYGADGALANEAQLDSTGQNKSIPNNCTNCHGGRYDTRTRRLTGSTFLPFDPEAFLFSERRGLGFADQERALKTTNEMIARAGAPPVAVQLVSGFYAGRSTNLDFIPAGWSGDEESKLLYREVYKPYCRTCHVSQVGDYAFMRIEDFKLEAAKTIESVCDDNQMPIAETTMAAFWNSPARAYLVNALGVSTPCAPKGAR
ncbi:MAG: hypothetical protein KIT84_06310 [Labilithrix sp.]|nr:hypothetical protein [Labilithrix sp.]MCW5810605.1 hypothetical protein [Labilithrix sp.]